MQFCLFTVRRTALFIFSFFTNSSLNELSYSCQQTPFLKKHEALKVFGANLDDSCHVA